VKFCNIVCMSSQPTLSTVASMLVQANHILARKQVLDGFGHVSARHPEHSDRFLISRSMAPALVSAADIMTLDLFAEPCDGDTRKPFLERFIHAAIYKARPDVGSVVHSHSPAVIPFSVVPGAPLRPICHTAGFIIDQAPVFEIREAAGEASDMLIRSPDLGTALAQRLGSSSVILLRGHGSAVVAPDIRLAVYRAIYLEVNARIQSEALRLGPVTYLNAAEAANIDVVNAAQIERSWDLWCREIHAPGSGATGGPQRDA
jgi:ribulose-5-phosphate 4-epimerase/fuculose-1-phosphate aldolase